MRTLLRVGRARVWRAISEVNEFCRWFGVDLHEPFAPGATLRGKMTRPGHEQLTWEITIDQMEPGRLLAWRWHPAAIEPDLDYSMEPRTRVELRLEDAPGGTELTVIESGFDGIHLARRREAHRLNENGWAAQLDSIAAWLSQAA